MEIVCAQINPLCEKKNQQFQMGLSLPIDTRTSHTFICISEFQYPLTSLNINKCDEFWFHLKINFAKFKQK